MIRRTVREWGMLPVDEPGEGAFTRHLADRLLDAARASPLGGDEGGNILVDHSRRLRAQQVVGVLTAPGVTLEILPKIDGVESEGATRRSLIHMLAAVIDLEVADGSISDLDWQKHDLLEVIIRIFCDHLFRAVHRGMPRAYIEREDEISALRGRLLIKKQFTTLVGTPQKLACWFSELSSDIALNQIMKATVYLLSTLTKSSANQRKLWELKFAFADVSFVPTRQLPWQQVTIDRTNKAWAQLFALAKLLLGQKYQNTSSGESRGFSLLFEMNELFEEFVGRSIKKALAETRYTVALQGPTDHALVEYQSSRRLFATRPDVVVLLDGRPVLIIDTKWKVLTNLFEDRKGGVAQSDIYQMMAYAHVYQCDQLVLLYPHHHLLGQRSGLVTAHRISGAEDKRLGIATIDLAEPKRAPIGCHELIFAGNAPLGLPLFRAA